MERFWEQSRTAVLRELASDPAGLTAEEASRRLRIHGRNSLARERRFTGLRRVARLFLDPLVVILLVSAAITLALGDQTGGGILIAMVLLSVGLGYLMEYHANRAVEALRRQVASTAAVLRDGKEQEIPVEEIVPGDVIRLNAGDLCPADSRLLEARDLHVRESAMTGESLPVEKHAGEAGSGMENSVFLGTAVQTGMGTAVVVHTGSGTLFGRIAERLAEQPPETEFGRGIRLFGLMITKVILLLVLFVLLVNLAMHRPLLESFLFSVALAVGMTPEMMPTIITVTLARGARRMTRKKVLLKQLSAMEDFGSIEILCSDKTGTLTEGEIELDRHVDITGRDDEEVLHWASVNSHFQAGIRSPLDDAILRHGHPAIGGYEKLDELPFDFQRRRVSVVVRDAAGACRLVSKGEVEGMLGICVLTDEERVTASATFQALSADGFRVLAVAVRNVDARSAYVAADEREMLLAGFAAFLDPPKEGLPEVLSGLSASGVRIVVMTGDNPYVTRKIAADVGIAHDRIVLGAEVDAMDNGALAYAAENGAIFARVTPEQKNRVIVALQARGHVVGYLGDGINDAPSLHTADVGISVQNGVDVAKDAAKVILLEKDLRVLHDGILEGRRSFANIMKYVLMGTSSNFGNMFSMAASSAFLPFLPMLPAQILLNNFLYDLSQVSIPSDSVDESLLRKPKRWRIGLIREFMTVLGPISSIYDMLTFAVLLYGFQAAANPALFHTGWFVESLATQTLVVFVIRTAGNPLRSRPGGVLTGAVLAVVTVGVVVPYTPLGGTLGFTPLPAALLGVIALLAVTYLVLVQMAKSWFYRRHELL